MSRGRTWRCSSCPPPPSPRLGPGRSPTSSSAPGSARRCLATVWSTTADSLGIDTTAVISTLPEPDRRRLAALASAAHPRLRGGPRPPRAGAARSRPLRLSRHRADQAAPHARAARPPPRRRRGRLMAVPFPSLGVPAMSHPDNAPRFDDLEGLALGDIAALPPEMLLDLQTTALAETARVKRLRDRLEAGIAQRYEAAAAAERAAQGKTCGTVRVEDEGVVVVADLPKKVNVGSGPARRHGRAHPSRRRRSDRVSRDRLPRARAAFRRLARGDARGLRGRAQRDHRQTRLPARGSRPVTRGGGTPGRQRRAGSPSAPGHPRRRAPLNAIPGEPHGLPHHQPPTNGSRPPRTRPPSPSSARPASARRRS